MALVAGLATACSEGPLPSLPQSLSDYGCDAVAQLLDNQGLMRSRGGDPAGAIGDFNAVLRVTPGCAIAYNNRGQAKMKLGDLQGAFEDFSEAIRLVPGYAAPYQNRGLVYSKSRNYPRALSDLNMALRLNPNFAAAYFNRSVVLMWLFRDDDSRADYVKTLELEPDWRGELDKETDAARRNRG